MPARPDVNRIVEFEALRGLLALWVVVGHAIKHAGYSKVDLGAFKFVAEPGLAVDVFIVLSGFVIFNLLDQQRQSYWTFIVQRFFRLYPLYLAVLLCSAAVAYRYEAWLALFPWQNDAVVSALKIAHATSQNLMAQLIVHLTMLQGIVPDFVLPKSEYAIVGQAWSISVEWQFYLVAPLLFWLVRRSPVALAGVVLALVAAHSQYWLGEGFALNQAGYFLIGILSYFAFKAISSQSEATISEDSAPNFPAMRGSRSR